MEFEHVLSERQACPSLQFHEGEVWIQKKRGTFESAFDMVVLGGMVETTMDPSVCEYIHSVAFVCITILGGDDEAVWSTVASGLPGEFIRARPDGFEIALSSILGGVNDPVVQTAEACSEFEIGLIAPDPTTRSRHRLDGVGCVSEGKLVVKLKRTFANCPKYIRTRHVGPGNKLASEPCNVVVVREARPLSAPEIEFVSSSDTFYIGSGVPSNGADTSHRGGLAGFVRVSRDGKTLRFGEYPGNGSSMTLGNIFKNGNACFLFLDHEETYGGTALQIRGKASVEFPTDPNNFLDGMDCMVLLVVEEVSRIEHSREPTVKFNHVSMGDSPFNPPLAGPGAPLIDQAAGVDYIIADSSPASANAAIINFSFKPRVPPGNGIVQQIVQRMPGDFVTFALPSHLGNGVEIRSYTIVSSPACKPTPTMPLGSFTIAVKRKPGGLATEWLYGLNGETPTVKVLGVSGNGLISSFSTSNWPIAPQPISTTILMISAGVGLTPMLANLRAVRDLHTAGMNKQASEWTLPRLMLLHSDRTMNSIAELEELQDLHKSGILTELVLVETQGESRRRIGRRHLEGLVTLCGDAKQHLSVLLCGPDTFMFPIKRTLIDSLGVYSGAIRQDDFTL